MKVFGFFLTTSIVFFALDSFVLLIGETNVDKVVKKMSSFLDLSNYPKEHPLYDGQHKNSLNKMKNELPDEVIINFAAVR